MESSSSSYRDIAKRTNGDIYIGVVGPVRTGKSTLIKKFMETVVIPNIESEFRRSRAVDELPQSAAGKTIMTTEPKFVPEEGVQVTIDGDASLNVRMIDCVGYIVPSAIGYFENEAPRMVMTPWSEQEMPFNAAAEYGTKKVITDHSTIGLVVTPDGSISDIPREEYEEAEQRVIDELKQINKPFAVLLNCENPDSEDAKLMCEKLKDKYDVPVMLTNCLELCEQDIKDILTTILYEFPIKEIMVEIPKWVVALDKDHWLKSAIYASILSASKGLEHIGQVRLATSSIAGNEYIKSSNIAGIDLGCGSAKIIINMIPELFYKILTELTGLEIENESMLIPCMTELSHIKKEYEKVRGALEEVEATGYGIVMPGINELSLEEPEIVKQGGKYGIKLKASAPSIHMLKADITAEVSPIVGSEKQSEELVFYMLKEFEDNPTKIWETNIFGTSLHNLVNEGLHNKLYRMPADARLKLQETIERVINEGCSGLICIII